MNRAILLPRISDADDGETAGVDDQLRRLRVFAEANGWTIAHEIIENDTSAFKRRKIKLPNGRHELRTVRPGFRQALELLAAGKADILVARDLDRAMRDPRDLEDLIDVCETSKGRVKARSISGSLRLDTDADVTMARVMVAMANKSSRDTARRVSDARERQAMAGEFGGGRRPYGFESDGVTVREGEAAIIRRMGDVVLLSNFGETDAKGKPLGPSLASIARELQTEGIPTADGKTWTAPTVRDILVRPRNAGLMVHKSGTGRKKYTRDDVVGRAPWAAIIPEDEFWIIAGKLNDPNRRTNTAGVAPKWLGSGVYGCPCGAVVRVSGSSGKRDRPVYTCGTRGEGTHANCPQADLDALVEGVAVVWLATYASDYITPRPGVDVGAIRAKISTLKAQRAEVGRDRDDRLIDRAEYVDRVKRINVQIEDLDGQLADMAEQSEFAEFADVATEEDAWRVWKGLGITRQRELVKKIMTVTLKPTGRGWRGTIDQRVSIEPVTPKA
ncbi:serine recombinase [Acrocarpospora pleiomorpha]|uniref:Serine recombinase n=1 Tax=Acrocarpospora pleiomorpha TaxID=90975 RepID=A0A5M3XG21_9ACTN|nr:recombinase family protein [Acrocarpospora pleiomorpha]GES20537.1 serine recombinase [Acrocarpospora pleiomorpha]